MKLKQKRGLTADKLRQYGRSADIIDDNDFIAIQHAWQSLDHEQKTVLTRFFLDPVPQPALQLQWELFVSQATVYRIKDRALDIMYQAIKKEDSL